MYCRFAAVAVGILVVSSSLMLFIASEPLSSVKGAPSDPIRIDGNGNFTSENGVVGGNGSADNPYLIENWTFSFSPDKYSRYIEISNTDSHVVLRNLHIEGSDIYADRGIALKNVSNCQILVSGLESVYEGLTIDSCSNIRINGTYFSESRIQVYQSTNITLTGNELVDCGINLEICENLVVENNSASNLGIGIFGYPLYVDRCMNMTLRDNSFEEGGFVIVGYSLEQYASHTYGDDNTVGGGPLKVYRDASGIDITGHLTGELLVINCTDIDMHEIDASTAGRTMIMVYCDWVGLSNSTFDESSGSIAFRYCSHLAITNNEFSDNSSTTLDSCSNVSFENNWYNGLYGAGLLGSGFSPQSCVDLTVRNNTFMEQDWEIYAYDCARMIFSGNALPLRGLRLEGGSSENFGSHTIDQTNTVGGKPLYYYGGRSNLTIDASDAGQLILGDCRDIEVSGFEGKDGSFCIQLGFVSRVNVTRCEFKDAMYAMSLWYSRTVVITECTFDCPGSTMAFAPCIDVRIYHNDFVSSGFGWSVMSGPNETVEGNITWDDGYPSGGNYWKYDAHGDTRKGPNQDTHGSDGIVDTPHEIGDLGVDWYPLVRPYDSSDYLVWAAAFALVLVGAAAAVMTAHLRRRRATPADQPSDVEELSPPQS